MKTLQYKIIKTRTQYNRYCETLAKLLFETPASKEVDEEIELLTLLIENWDKEHSYIKESDPIQLLISFMKDHNLNAIKIATILDVSKSTMSEILNYKKGLSKNVIRKLSDYFKVNQEAFNREYALKTHHNSGMHDEKFMNYRKNMNVAA